jgi:hypothetical protein
MGGGRGPGGGERPGGARQNGGRGGAQSGSVLFGGTYIVFVLKNGQPTPVEIRTGLTDLDYSEIRSGLTASDTVLILPSASLIASQEQDRERASRMAGGVPGMTQGSTPGGGPGRGGPR